MRHRKDTFKLSRTSSHCRCLIANMLKALITHGSIETSVVKAKELRRAADRMVTLAKKGTLASRRQAIAAMMIRYNGLTPKEARAAKKEDRKAYNDDRVVIEKLFGGLSERFKTRPGGYTRIIKLPQQRVGDNCPRCIIEYLPE
jgi:large subunit ribosomal protein L17